MKNVFCDMHAHVLFGVDDGSSELGMSLNMLRNIQEQGGVAVFATAHDYCSLDEYEKNFKQLLVAMQEANINIELYCGREVLFLPEDVEYSLELIRDAKNRLNSTEYALIEFEPSARADFILRVVKQLINELSVTPIIAHVERYWRLIDDPEFIDELLVAGAYFQVNAYSLAGECDQETMEFARKIVLDQKASFIGSDCHKTMHRPPKLSDGIAFIYENCDKEYARNLCIENARHRLGVNV